MSVRAFEVDGLVERSVRNGGGWGVAVVSPPFVDGSELIVRFHAREARGEVLVDGPRAPASRASHTTMDRASAIGRLAGLLHTGWRVAPPWRDAGDPEPWLRAALGGATFRPCLLSDATETIEREGLVRWHDAERVVDLRQIARSLRFDRLALWREPDLRTGAWAIASAPSISDDPWERAYLLARIRIA